MVSSKKPVPAIFKIALRLRDRHAFIWQSVEIRYLIFETDFLENENFFQKTGVLFFNWKH